LEYRCGLRFIAGVVARDLVMMRGALIAEALIAEALGKTSHGRYATVALARFSGRNDAGTGDPKPHRRYAHSAIVELDDFCTKVLMRRRKLTLPI
jgi:hypothetical protein